MYAGMCIASALCALHVRCMCTARALHERCMCTARLGYRIVYLQPRTDPRKGPLGSILFLRKVLGPEPPPPVD